jgi:protein associated with RNAse G/E
MDLQPGTVLTLRDVIDRTVWFAFPVAVVADGLEALEVVQFAGTTGQAVSGYPTDWERVHAQLLADERTMDPVVWRTTHCVHVFQPEHPWWSTRLMWSADSGGFLGWYVDFRKPLLRHGSFLDTRDLQLDVVVPPDRDWRWKDEEVYAQFVREGLIDATSRRAVEACREEVILSIQEERTRSRAIAVRKGSPFRTFCRN